MFGKEEPKCTVKVAPYDPRSGILPFLAAGWSIFCRQILPVTFDEFLSQPLCHFGVKDYEALEIGVEYEIWAAVEWVIEACWVGVVDVLVAQLVECEAVERPEPEE